MLPSESTGPDDGIAAITPDGDSTDHIPDVLHDAAAAEDGSGALATDSLSEPAWTIEPVMPAGLAAGAMADITTAGLGCGGTIQAPAHAGDLISHTGIDPAAPLDIAGHPPAPVLVASLANPAEQSSAAVTSSAAASFGIGKITLVGDDDDGTGPSGPSSAASQPNVTDAVATIGSGVTISQSTTHADGSITETVAFAGSGIVFNNTFASGLTQAYINCAIAAEQTVASQWSNPVTISESFTAEQESQNGELASNNFYVIGVSYATLKNALMALASREPGDVYLQQAFAHLPSTDPSGGAGFELTLPYARMLGLTTATGTPDDTVTLNTSYNWSYGQDVINTLTHEISEGGMGRIGGLGDQNGFWSVMDLFRYNSSGVADYSDGRDQRTTYFSSNGGATLSSLSFNNEYSGSSHVNNGDTADFNQLDVFGTGSPGETFTLSQTDIQVMEALGWTQPQGPIVSASNAFLSTTSVAASSLFTVSDRNGEPITEYAFMDTGPGHFVLNGVTEPDNTEIDITAAQLSQLIYQSVPGTDDTLQIRAEDALAWGAWTSFVVTAPQVSIQVDTNSFGSTSLFEVDSQYALENSSGNGPHLQLNGTPVIAGQLSPWVLIGAALTATGYEVAWQLGGSFDIWDVDSNGNYLSQTGSISGTSYALETYETSFHQDLNGDGAIGVTSTVIESNGTTTLVAVADQYALENSSRNGPHLQLNGAPVVAGQLSPWVPFAVVQTATGYEVAWQLGDSFDIWNTDSNGNYVSQSGSTSGSSYALESYETIFDHDLNGDGTIGITSTVIESNGTTSLVAVADQYALENSSGNGPHLQLNGVPVTAGELGPWVPVAAAQTATGYEVAWQLGSNFDIWFTDSNGNYLSQSGSIPGASPALETYEVSFDHDLNGDGVIGIPSGAGATVQTANAASGITTFDGATLTLDASTASNEQIVGFTGNGAPAGSDQIDLRGLSYNSLQASFNSSSDTLSLSDGSTTVSLQFLGQYSQDNFHFADDGNGGTLVIAAAPPGQSGGANQVSNLAAQDTFVFAPNFGQVSLANFAPATDTLQFSKSVFANVAAVLAATHDDASGNAVITDAAHDTITLQHVTTAQLLAHQSDVLIV
jgi:hypothetical protein